MRFCCALQAALLAAFLLTACASQPSSAPAPAPASTPALFSTSTPLPQRAPLLRVAVLGETTTTNVWAIFDETGASYWNAATQTDYWPQLFRLAPLSLNVEPAAAKSAPSPMTCDAATCSATVSLRSDLTWSNGSPFTAEDVAFTANTALQFHLGLNWRSAYNPDVLERAEPLDKTTVKFYFKGKPSVAEWQYGVLQGPIVSKSYWMPRIQRAVSILPEDTIWESLHELARQSADKQAHVNDLELSLNGLAPDSQAYQDTVRQAAAIQDDLNAINNKLGKERIAVETQVSAAREALFSLGNATEPTLGPWIFFSDVPGKFTNKANLDAPFGTPWFDNVEYITYTSESTAVEALRKDDVDLILTPNGLSNAVIDSLRTDDGVTVVANPTTSARFLVINGGQPYLADVDVRKAIACAIDPASLASNLGEQIVLLHGFVLPEVTFWHNMQAQLPCAAEDAISREEQIRQLLPNDLPTLRLLAPAPDVDPLRARAAELIVESLQQNGIQVTLQFTDVETILYAVYGSGQYDLAVLGWRLSAFPAYLCDWFEGRNPFGYNGSRLTSACEALGSESELARARELIFDVQAVLAEEVPFVPLYVDVRYDAFRNMHYPFGKLVNGLGGLYGAPALAIPNP